MMLRILLASKFCLHFLQKLKPIYCFFSIQTKTKTLLDNKITTNFLNINLIKIYDILSYRNFYLKTL